jgi:hypothetical protein
MLYYIFLEFCFFSLLILPKKFRKTGLIIILMFVTLFLSTKEPTYYDLINYKEMFEYANINQLFYPEISFVILSSLLKKIGLNFYYLTTIYYGLMFYFLYKGISNFTKHYEISFIIFLLFPIFFLSDYIALRQAVAISLFFYSISLFLKRKKSFYFYALLSISFHYSAFFAYIIFFLISKFLSKKFHFVKYIIVIILSYLLSFIFLDILVNLVNIFSSITVIQKYALLSDTIQRYNYYITKEQFHTNVIRTLIYTSLYLFILLIFLNCKKNNNNNILFNLFTIGIVITILGSSNMNVNRFANYFMIFVIVLIPNLLLSTIKLSKLQKNWKLDEKSNPVKITENDIADMNSMVTTIHVNKVAQNEAENLLKMNFELSKNSLCKNPLSKSSFYS